MLYTPLSYLEQSAKKHPYKVAFSDGVDALTFAALHAQAKSIGTFLAQRCGKEPVAVFMNRHPAMVAAFMGVLYAGGIYLPLDEEMSRHRIGVVVQNVRPAVLLCDAKTIAAARQLAPECEVYLLDEALQTPVDETLLAAQRATLLDTDPAYIVFTSGSTGVPKGVVANHRNILDYAEALSATVGAGHLSVFGMQAPLYVDAFLKDIFLTLKHGATAYIIPKALFMFPLKLIEFLNAHEVNTLCWVVSALTMLSGMRALEKAVPQHVHTVVFGGEVFPLKQFALWCNALPKARFFNMYGPTECTGFSCWYEVPPGVPTSPLPIGRPFANTGVLLVGEDGREVQKDGQAGEVYIRGAGVTPGYYNDAERTAASFVQNPLQNAYPETVYRTGDIAQYNQDGQLLYLARKDHQIKHMGYRIELPEIEAAAITMPGLENACCVFDDDKSKIVLYYMGTPEGREVTTFMRNVLPRYMVPAAALPLPRMPQTQNGKIDRELLTRQAKELP